MRLHLQLTSLLTAFFFVLALGISNNAFAINDPVIKDETVTSYTNMMNTSDNTVIAIDEQLGEIESLISEHGLTYDEFIAKYPEHAEAVSLSKADVINSMYASDSPLGLPAFLWGFCLGWVGILIVWLVSKDSRNSSAHVRSAVWGCVTAGALYLVVYLALLLIYGSALGGLYFW